MAKIAPWYSTRRPFTLGESVLDGPDVLGGDPQVYHDNNECPDGKKIPPESRASGTGGRKLCERCQALS